MENNQGRTEYFARVADWETGPELSIDDALEVFFTKNPLKTKCEVVEVNNLGIYTREHFENIDMHPED